MRRRSSPFGSLGRRSSRPSETGQIDAHGLTLGQGPHDGVAFDAPCSADMTGFSDPVLSGQRSSNETPRRDTGGADDCHTGDRAAIVDQLIEI